jgi:hypothetical protein
MAPLPETTGTLALITAGVGVARRRRRRSDK